MPIYEYECIEGHTQEHYVASYRAAKKARFHCQECPPFLTSLMVFNPGCWGQGLLWFEQGRERTIHNLGHEPVRITSKKQHEAAMKKAGVTHAGSRRGERGVWI